MRTEADEFSQYHIKQAYMLFKGQCFKCSTYDRMEVDHHMPVHLGGKPTTNNCVLLCKSCNRKKSSKHPTKFYSNVELDRLYKEFKVETLGYNDHLGAEARREKYRLESAHMLGNALKNQHIKMKDDKEKQKRLWSEYESQVQQDEANFHAHKQFVRGASIFIGIFMTVITIGAGGHDAFGNITDSWDKAQAEQVANQKARKIRLAEQKEKRDIASAIYNKKKAKEAKELRERNKKIQEKNTVYSKSWIPLKTGIYKKNYDYQFDLSGTTVSKAVKDWEEVKNADYIKAEAKKAWAMIRKGVRPDGSSSVASYYENWKKTVLGNKSDKAYSAKAKLWQSMK